MPQDACADSTVTSKICRELSSRSIARCIFFKQVYGRETENRVAGDKIVSGRFCEAARDPNADMLIDNAFYFLDQLRQNNRKIVQLGDLAPSNRPARIEAEA